MEKNGELMLYGVMSNTSKGKRVEDTFMTTRKKRTCSSHVMDRFDKRRTNTCRSRVAKEVN